MTGDEIDSSTADVFSCDTIVEEGDGLIGSAHDCGTASHISKEVLQSNNLSPPVFEISWHVIVADACERRNNSRTIT